MHFLRILLTYSILRAAAAASTVFTDNLPNFSDEVHERKYDIALSRHTYSEGGQSEADFRILAAHNARREEYSCHIPTAPASPVEENKEPDETPLPSTLLDSLKGLCLSKTQDWWTYELCYQQQVLQFHKQGEDPPQQFNLGKFSANESDVDAIHWEVGTTGASSAYVKEVYDEGSVCDVKEVHRSTEVRYICSEGSETLMMSIREVHSCSYQILVATPLICQHPAFRGVQDPVHTITCFPTQTPKDPDIAEADVDVREKVSEKEEKVEAGQADTTGEGIEKPKPQDKGLAVAQGLEIDLDTLSEEAMDELVASMMRQTSQDDPDIDFLGLEEQDEEIDLDEGMSEGAGSSKLDGKDASDLVESPDEPLGSTEEVQEQPPGKHEEL